jgi:hypothetical protein
MWADGKYFPLLNSQGAVKKEVSDDLELQP